MTSSVLKTLFKEFREINKKSVYDNQACLEFPQGEENPLLLHIVSLIMKIRYGYIPDIISWFLFSFQIGTSADVWTIQKWKDRIRDEITSKLSK
jgi:hypothetical protein